MFNKMNWQHDFRHKEDNRANSLEVSVVQGEATSVIKSMNIKVKPSLSATLLVPLYNFKQALLKDKQ